ncbi:MAG TPA: hypothetical protein VGB55_00635 [Tepidisphaeraceae bacterium]|jgi:hypothetical protein
MKRPILSLAVMGLFLSTLAQQTPAYPQPSKYPIAWELKFEHSAPRRIVVETPGTRVPTAYWYITYTVTNNTDNEINFLPAFDMVTRSGKVLRSDRGVPRAVFDRIKGATGNKLLESNVEIAGTLRVGADQAKDGVAIWPEPEAEMGSFSIFVAGLSGESAVLADDAGKPMITTDDKPIILFKTLQLDYNVSGDEVFPGIDPVRKTNMTWIMR